MIWVGIILGVVVGSVIGTYTGIKSVDLWFDGHKVQGAALFFGVLAAALVCLTIGIIGASS